MTTKEILLRNRINANKQDLQKQLDAIANMIKAVDLPVSAETAGESLRAIKSTIAQLQIASEIAQELIYDYREDADHD